MKSVRFDDDVLELRYQEERTSNQMWFSDQDLQTFKAERYLLALHFQQANLQDWLTSSFGASTSVEVQNKLNAIAALEEPHCARGIEKHVCRKHGSHRKTLKVKLQKGVLNKQKNLKASHNSDKSWEVLAETSRRLSREASSFALKMARADEYACRLKNITDIQGELTNETESRKKQIHRDSNPQRNKWRWDSYILPTSIVLRFQH